MYKDFYSIKCFQLSLIIIPKCCSKFSGDFLFNGEDISTLFKDSLILYCPVCNVSYPSSHFVFRKTAFINIILSNINSDLEKQKKNGLRILASTPPISYAIIDSLINFKNSFDHYTSDVTSNPELLEKQIKSTIEVVAKNKTPKYISNNGIEIGPLSSHCQKCDEISILDNIDFSIGKLFCANCSNSQRVAKRKLKLLFETYDEFQKSILLSNKTDLVIIPFSLNGIYASHINGDNQIFKAINNLI